MVPSRLAAIKDLNSVNAAASPDVDLQRCWCWCWCWCWWWCWCWFSTILKIFIVFDEIPTSNKIPGQGHALGRILCRPNCPTWTSRWLCFFFTREKHCKIAILVFSNSPVREGFNPRPPSTAVGSTFCPSNLPLSNWPFGERIIFNFKFFPPPDTSLWLHRRSMLNVFARRGRAERGAGG